MFLRKIFLLHTPFTGSRTLFHLTVFLFIVFCFPFSLSSQSKKKESTPLSKKGKQGICLVIYNPYGPGNHEEAKKIMEEFSQVLSKLGETKIEVTYFSNPASFQKFVKEKSPSYLLTNPFVFKRLEESWSLQPLFQVIKNKQKTKKYYLCLPKGKKLSPFKEIHIFSHHFIPLSDFLHIFQLSQQAPKKKIHLHYYSKFTRVLRKMIKGRKLRGQPVDAILLDEFDWKTIQETPHFKKKYGEKLKMEKVSLPCPIMILGVIKGKSAYPGLSKALLALSQHEKGKKILHLFGMDQFLPLSQEEWKKTKSILEPKNPPKKEG